MERSIEVLSQKTRGAYLNLPLDECREVMHVIRHCGNCETTLLVGLAPGYRKWKA
jgi:hypothetical protein